MMSRWIVPVDNTAIMLPGQLPNAESYEASQRQPGDYEAQVGQRPIAIHGLEHLGATDRGIIMFRRQIQRGIRAVQNGQDPEGLCREVGKAIPTYCNDTVGHVLPEATPEADKKLMRQTGWTLAQEYLKSPPLLVGR
jgi:hypothetical protein